MALCVLGALVALGKGLGADVPELAKLHQRVVDLPKDAPMAFPMDER
jgi:hypothetical protein